MWLAGLTGMGWHRVEAQGTSHSSRGLTQVKRSTDDALTADFFHRKSFTADSSFQLRPRQAYSTESHLYILCNLKQTGVIIKQIPPAAIHEASLQQGTHVHVFALATVARGWQVKGTLTVVPAAKVGGVKRHP